MEILYRNREEITRTFQKNCRRFPKRMKNLPLSRSISKSRIGGTAGAGAGAGRKQIVP